MIALGMLTVSLVFAYNVIDRVLLHYERKRFAPKETIVKLKAA